MLLWIANVGFAASAAAGGSARKHYSYQVCAIVRMPAMRLPDPE